MLQVNAQAIGIDAAEIERFRSPQTARDSRFAATTFSEVERDYCFSYSDPAPHLAATFACKEAVRKVFGDDPLSLCEIEVRRTAAGKPEIWLKGERQQSILVSITHTATTAFAVAIKSV